jgi:PrtD family type I secretion system ABC transporter
VKIVRDVVRLVPGAVAPLAWTAFFSFFLNVLYLAAPLYMMQVYDRVMRSQSVPTLLYLTLAVAICYATLAILDGVRGQILGGISDIIEAQLGSVLLRQATAPLAAQQRRPSAGLLARDLDLVRQFAAGPAMQAFVDLPWAPFYIVVIFLLHWTLAVFAVVASLLLMALSYLAERAARAPMGRANDAANQAYQFGDSVSRYGDCASTMGLGPRVTQVWQAMRRQMLEAQNEASRRAVILGAIARFARMFLQSAILGFGAWLAIRHDISGGAVFAGSLLLGRTLAPVEGLIGAWRGTIAAHGAFTRIAALAVPIPEPRLVVPNPSGELSLENVVWTPPGAERPALRGITIKIEAGAVLVVIGPSAAGKSTLARLLTGAIVPAAGTVRLDGAELGSWNRDQLATSIGYLPQEVALFPGNIAENIARFGEAPDAVIVEAAQNARAHEMILRLRDGYATRLDEGSALLSGGQRQRVALARALFGDPPVLVLDEPNANLDAEGEAGLIAAVIEARRRHRTVVMITHNLALVRVADYVATMVGGHIMKVQKTAEFLGKPTQLAATA